ncbi:hypothetical protein ABFV05_004715 [Capra hircus]
MKQEWVSPTWKAHNWHSYPEEHRHGSVLVGTRRGKDRRVTSNREDFSFQAAENSQPRTTPCLIVRGVTHPLNILGGSSDLPKGFFPSGGRAASQKTGVGLRRGWSGRVERRRSAYDTRLRQRVAVKKLSRPFQSLIHARRTYRELRLLKHLKHENVIGLLDVFTPATSLEDFSEVYLVTTLMGADLNNIVKCQALSDEHVQFLVYQLLRGLKYIHSAGIIHRDLKPSNVAVNEDCELRILDFGLARQADEEMTGYVATRWYRAPEIMLNWMHYSQTVDIWSVGCIMAELLQGKALFPGSDYIDQLKRIMEVVGTPSPEVLAKISSEHLWTSWAGCWCWTVTRGSAQPRPWHMLTSASTTTRRTSQRRSPTTRAWRPRSARWRSGRSSPTRKSSASSPRSPRSHWAAWTLSSDGMLLPASRLGLERGPEPTCRQAPVGGACLDATTASGTQPWPGTPVLVLHLLGNLRVCGRPHRRELRVWEPRQSILHVLVLLPPPEVPFRASLGGPGCRKSTPWAVCPRPGPQRAGSVGAGVHTLGLELP